MKGKKRSGNKTIHQLRMDWLKEYRSADDDFYSIQFDSMEDEYFYMQEHTKYKERLICLISCLVSVDR